MGSDQLKTFHLLQTIKPFFERTSKYPHRARWVENEGVHGPRESFYGYYMRYQDKASNIRGSQSDPLESGRYKPM